MKSYCKIDKLHDREFCFGRVLEAFHRKWGRKNYQRTLAQYMGCSLNKVRGIIKYGNKTELYPVLYAIADEFIREVDARHFVFTPIIYKDRVDGLSGKTRTIGIMSVKQQCYEHIIVGALMDLFNAKIVAHQFASIEGRGQVAGMNRIKEWIHTDLWSEKCAKKYGGRYKRKITKFVKLDISKCFPSIKREVVMKFLSRDIHKNKLLLWAVDEILQVHEAGGHGLIIGSLLSQFLCNYLMSYMYREVMGYEKTRRDKRIRLVMHAAFFMDDILLLGNDRRNMKMAVRKLIVFARENLGLTIKPNWHIKDLDLEPIDMMGFVIHGNCKITIRSKIFLRARRAFLRAKSRTMTVRLAKRLMAYYGYIKHTNSGKMRRELCVKRIRHRARRTISKSDREGIK